MKKMKPQLEVLVNHTEAQHIDFIDRGKKLRSKRIIKRNKINKNDKDNNMESLV